MSAVLLMTEGLSVGRGGVRLLDGLDLTVGPGEALMLRGPNGCGKTTLLRTLAGLQPALAGQIRIAAAQYSGHLDGIKAQLTVAENLRFWARVTGTGGISSALERFDLTALADRPARLLSAGQKRRLGLARLALAERPVWLLDEPTVALDAASVARFADIVAEHLGKGGVALIATHVELGLAARDLDLTRFRAQDRNADAFGGAW